MENAELDKTVTTKMTKAELIFALSGSRCTSTCSRYWSPYLYLPSVTHHPREDGIHCRKLQVGGWIAVWTSSRKKAISGVTSEKADSQDCGWVTTDAEGAANSQATTAAAAAATTTTTTATEKYAPPVHLAQVRSADAHHVPLGQPVRVGLNAVTEPLETHGVEEYNLGVRLTVRRQHALGLDEDVEVLVVKRVLFDVGAAAEDACRTRWIQRMHAKKRKRARTHA